jgi:Recombinase
MEPLGRGKWPNSGATPKGPKPASTGKIEGPGKGKLELVKEHAAVVQSIFELAREGARPGRIARRLSHDGVPSPRGKGWNRQTITNILLAQPGLRRRAPQCEEGQPAIVSRQLWNAVNR